MTVSVEPPPSVSPQIDLREPDLGVLDALADGDLEQACELAALRFGACFVEPAWRRTWLRRAAQLRHDPAIGPWITRLIIDSDSGLVVGRAGFHGRPDANGLVEVGYAVDPNFRRRGYARAALVRLLEEADERRHVVMVRACVAPDNHASRSLLAQYGFLEVGEHWDEEDGVELVYETLAKPRIRR